MFFHLTVSCNESLILQEIVKNKISHINLGILKEIIFW